MEYEHQFFIFHRKWKMKNCSFSIFHFSLKMEDGNNGMYTDHSAMRFCMCCLIFGQMLYLRIKFRQGISIHGQVISTSGCWRQTSAIFKLYFRFRRTLHLHPHFVILQWPTKFYANRMIADGVMTSYWFYKKTAIVSQIYFRCLIWPRVTFRKMQSYRHNKFRPDISIHGRDITTSGFWKRTVAILKF